MCSPSFMTSVWLNLRRCACAASGLQSEDAPVGSLVGAGGGKVIKAPVGGADHVPADERRTLARAILRMLQAAFPFEHGPALIAVLRELAEHLREIDLPIAGRAEASRSFHPVQVAAIHAGAATGAELRILHMEGANARVVVIDVRQIVQLLQHEVAGVIKDAGRDMV